MVRRHLLSAAVPAMLLAGDLDTAWKSELERGRKAVSVRDFAGATEIYRAALARAEAAPGAEAVVIDALRASSEAARLQGRFAEAQEFLARAIRTAETKYGDASLEAGALLSELGGVQRSRGERKDALASLARAIRIRESHPQAKREDLARDTGAAALLHVALGDMPAARDALTHALSLWETAAAPDNPQLLPLLDALGVLYRDAAEYARAEPLFLRALVIRESVLGPDSSELSSTLDSLAYVYFGQKKLAEAEPVYRRLLALWETSAGPEHPMVALTLDKMAEFYAFQQNYAEAEALASRALALRTNAHIASLNQTGRILLMEAKLPEAEDLYRRAIAAGDLVKAQNEVLDPLLRVYGKVLRAIDKPAEADAVEQRAKDALIQKADREGRRPAPRPK